MFITSIFLFFVLARTSFAELPINHAVCADNNPCSMGELIFDSESDPVVLQAVYRDLPYDHPDVNRPGGVDLGFIGDTLLPDGTPDYLGGPSGTSSTNGEDSFYTWFHGDAIPGSMMVLKHKYYVALLDKHFFPVKHQGYGNQAPFTNHYFTAHIVGKAIYHPNLVSVLGSDDDAWLFINGLLFLDNGGTHSYREVTLDYDKMAESAAGLVDGEPFLFDLFFADRKGDDSRIFLSFNTQLIGTACNYTHLPGCMPCPSGHISDCGAPCECHTWECIEQNGEGAICVQTALPGCSTECYEDVDCEDDHHAPPCTEWVCHKEYEWEETGMCALANMTNGTACEDHNACTETSFCYDGVCKPGDPVDCDDGNLCTLDSCDPRTGCHNLEVEHCHECEEASDCYPPPHPPHPPHPPRQVEERYPPGHPYPPHPPPHHYPPPPPECARYECIHMKCIMVPVENHEEESCSDGNPCTEGDICIDGQCVGEPVPGCCHYDMDCPPPFSSNTEECMWNECDQELHECVPHYKVGGTRCSDGDWCTVGDTCDDEGNCEPGPERDCQPGPCQHACCNSSSEQCEFEDDYDCMPCETDQDCELPGHVRGENCHYFICVDHHCEKRTEEGGTPCDDNPCWPEQICLDGVCIPDGLGLDCDDEMPCTWDWCDPLAQTVETACHHDPIPGCLPCTSDVQCQDLYHPVDSCVEYLCIAEECVRRLKEPGTECDDNNECTQDDQCDGIGHCIGGPVVCDDEDETTVDWCDPQQGCMHASHLCCAEDDDCRGVHDKPSQCQHWVCDEPSGMCDVAPDRSHPCDLDGDEHPCWEGLCSDGQCEPTPTNNGGQCTLPGEQVPCTKGTCQDGRCELGPDDSLDDTSCTPYGQMLEPDPDDCIDRYVCDHGACRPDAHPNGDSCDNGGDCDAGKRCCRHGECICCDDGNPCTDDWCDDTGCHHLQVPWCGHCQGDGDCDENHGPCREGRCVDAPDGHCEYEPLEYDTDCSDENTPHCQRSRCDQSGLCEHVPDTSLNGLRCDDGDSCSHWDQCLDGECVGTTHGGDTCEPCDTDQDCDTYGECTTGRCVQGTCRYEPEDDDTPCGPGHANCREHRCQGGLCVGEIDPSQTGALCDDGHACGYPSRCDAKGNCLSQPGSSAHCFSDPDCDDGNDCTTNVCMDGKCCSTPTGGPCHLDSPCINGHCSAGECVVDDLVDCSDGNSSTVDWCDPELGCQHTYCSGTIERCCVDNDDCRDPTGAPFPGNNECLRWECLDGRCNVDTWTSEDDACDPPQPALGGECSRYRCRSGECTHEAAAWKNGDLCDLGDHGQCVEGRCDDGHCVASPVDGFPPTACMPHPSMLDNPDNDCRDWACDNGDCVPVNENDYNGLECGSSAQPPLHVHDCRHYVCSLGRCVSDPDSTQNGDSCDDSDPCTDREICVDGHCQGIAIDCDDQNECTRDRCDPRDGFCDHEPIESCEEECDYDWQCWGESQGEGGDLLPCHTCECVDRICRCRPQEEGTLCDDGDDCTDQDQCDPYGQCSGTPICGPCQTCDPTGACIDLPCAGGQGLCCDQQNPCEERLCHDSECLSGQCVYTPHAVNTSCDDGNACTTDDQCNEYGECLGHCDDCDDADILSYPPSECEPQDLGCPVESEVARIPCDPQSPDGNETCRCAYAYEGPLVWLTPSLKYQYVIDPCGRRLGPYGPVDEVPFYEPGPPTPNCLNFVCLPQGYCAVIRKEEGTPCMNCLHWMDQPGGFCHDGFCISDFLNEPEQPPCPREGIYYFPFPICTPL